MQQPTSGMSQPSVSTMQFVTSSMSPDANRASEASRSGFGVDPSMCSARTPDLMNSSRRWTECLAALAREGATAWLEVGPGRVLSGLLKRTIDGARGHAVEDPDSLEKAAAALGGGPGS